MPLDHATRIVARRGCDPGRVMCIGLDLVIVGWTRESWVRGEVVARDGTPDPASFRALGLGVLVVFFARLGAEGAAGVHRDPHETIRHRVSAHAPTDF